MTRINFKFWLNDVEKMELVNWLKELTSKEKFTETVVEILDFVRKNGLENLKSLEALRREKIIAEIAEIKSRTSHRDSKDKPITPPNQPKVETNQTSYVAPEEKKLEQIIKSQWNNYVGTLRKKPEGWLITCKLCPTGFPQIRTKEEAIERLKTHLEETHEKELLQTV